MPIKRTTNEQSKSLSGLRRKSYIKFKSDFPALTSPPRSETMRSLIKLNVEIKKKHFKLPNAIVDCSWCVAFFELQFKVLVWFCFYIANQ
jgi:hypothetical protein